MNNSFLNNVLSMMKDIEKLNELEFNNITCEINNIIKYDIKDQNKIENIFDRLLSLDLLEEERINILYFRLLEYYKNINLEATKDYEKYYNEKYIEEDKNKIKKKI